MPPPPPAAPVSSPQAERLVNELLLTLLLVPLLANGSTALLAHLRHQPSWSGSVGALVFVSAPCLVGVAFLALTRAFWAAWIAWGLELVLLGFLSLGDVHFAHAPTPRLVLSALLLPLLAWRITRLQRLQRAPLSAR